MLDYELEKLATQATATLKQAEKTLAVIERWLEWKVPSQRREPPR